MSTVVVVKKNGRVAIAADTLVSYGSRKLSAAHNTHAGKIIQVGLSYFGSVGFAVTTMVLDHLFTTRTTIPSVTTREEIFDLFRKLHPRLKDDYFLNPAEDFGAPYESSHLTLLVANCHGIFGVYALRDVFEYERFWSNGSGSEYAMGAMQALYDREFDALQIAEAGVSAAIQFDQYTGAPIESHVIDLIESRQVAELERLLKV